MSSEIVVAPAELDAMQQHARLLASARSDLIPPQFRNSPGDVLMAIEYGRSLNLPVAQIFTEIYIVKGRPSMSAKLMMALVLRAGHRIRADIAADGRSATCKIVRSDDPEPYLETFTVEDAVQAGLCELKNGKVWARDSKGQPTPWERYTRTMLRNRAISTAVRAFCPDVLAAVAYTPEELRDGFEGEQPEAVAPASGRRVTAADIINATPEPPATPEPEIVDAEIVPDEPDRITNAQSRRMHAMFTDAKITDREQRLAFVADVIGIEVASSKDLSREQADKVIDALSPDPNTPEAQDG